MRLSVLAGSLGAAALVGAVLGGGIGVALVLAGVVGLIAWLAVERRAGAAARTAHAELLAEIRRHEDRQARDRTLHEALLDALDVGIAAFREGRLVFINRRATALLGDRVSSVSDPLPGVVKTVIERASSGQIAGGRYETGYPTRVIEAVAHYVGDAAVVIVRLIDVTDRLRTEAMRRDFVAAASHELKTPAAAIQAAAETVLTALEDDPEAVREFSSRIYDNSTRLARIVSDLLDLSRLEGGGHSFEALDLAEIVEEEVARIASIPQALEVQARPAPMWGSRADLALAVRNLLGNAARYTPEDGHISIRVVERAARTVLEVADDGAGIPSTVLPRVFERFYRVDDARSRATGGTGLGLAIVKHVAEQHGGTVEAESTLGEGSIFRMVFPPRSQLPASDPSLEDVR